MHTEEEQFFSNNHDLKEYLSKSDSLKKNVSRSAYIEKIATEFTESHYEKGELYMKYTSWSVLFASTKQSNVSLAAIMAGLVHKWIEFLGHSQYKSVFDIAEKQLNGEKRQADDFQSGKNLKDEFENNRTSLINRPGEHDN